MWLGERATERNLKALSREDKLARYKVLHFATLGRVASGGTKFDPVKLLLEPMERVIADFAA